MKQGKKEAVADRRSFLKLAGAGAAAGGAALVTGETKARGRGGQAQGRALSRDRAHPALLRARALTAELTAGRKTWLPPARTTRERGMLRKKMSGVAKAPRLSSALQEQAPGTVDRRAFLRNSGLAIGGLAAVSAVAGGRVREAEAAAPTAGGKIDIKKSVCTHCSVGCTIMAEVQNGVWIGQEPGFDSPLNLGAHCAKGAAAREHAHGDRRLKYPMKLVGGNGPASAGTSPSTRSATRCSTSARSRARTRSTSWAPPSSPTSRPTCSASSTPSGAPTTATIRRASATPRPSRASRTRGATAP